MSRPRQQRAKIDRRQVSVATPAHRPDLCISLTNAAAKSLTISLSNNTLPANNNGQIAPVSLSGIPKVLRLADSTYPVSAVKGGAANEIVLTYGGANIADLELFQSSPQDPAVRDAFGCFMAQANLRWHND